MTPANLAQAALNLLQDTNVRLKVGEHFSAVHRLMRRDAADRAAEALMPLIEGRA